MKAPSPSYWTARAMLNLHKNEWELLILIRSDLLIFAFISNILGSGS